MLDPQKADEPEITSLNYFTLILGYSEELLAVQIMSLQ